MSTLLRFKTYPLVFLFYKPLSVLSSIVTIFLFVMDTSFLMVLTLKLILLALIFILFWEGRFKKRLVFYQNFGISKIHLFVISYIFDVIIAIPLYLILIVWF